MSKITFQIIEEAKKKHEEVYVIEVDMNEQENLSESFGDEDEKVAKFDTSKELLDKPNVYRGIVTKPPKRVIGLAMTSKDPIQMGNIILKNQLLDGYDSEIMDNDDVNIAAALQVIKFISIGRGALKKF